MTSSVRVPAAIVGMSLVVLTTAASAQTAMEKTPSAADVELCTREAQVNRAGVPGANASPSTTRPRSRPSAPATVGVGSSPVGAAGAGAAAGSSTSGGSTLASGDAVAGTAGSEAADPQVPAAGDQGLSDAAYRQAYRDCMARRGF